MLTSVLIKTKVPTSAWLRDMDFANKKFKVGGGAIACVSYFGFPEKMATQAIEARERIERELFLK